MASIDMHEGSKYLRAINPADGKGTPIRVDVYEVILAFRVTCPARQHAIKKLLCAGTRDKGGTLDDLIGCRAAIDRAIELEASSSVSSDRTRRR